MYKRMILVGAALLAGTTTAFGANSLSWDELASFLRNNVTERERAIEDFRKDAIDVQCPLLGTEELRKVCVAVYEFVVAERIAQKKNQEFLIEVSGLDPTQRDKLLKIIPIQALNRAKERTTKQINELGKFFFIRH